jgi:hypothetical protein
VDSSTICNPEVAPAAAKQRMAAVGSLPCTGTAGSLAHCGVAPSVYPFADFAKLAIGFTFILEE